MKTLILISILIIALSLNLNAQEPQKSSTSTKDTTINKVYYKLYTGIRGGKYIIVVSKTGTTYKRYFKR